MSQQGTPIRGGGAPPPGGLFPPPRNPAPLQPVELEAEPREFFADERTPSDERHLKAHMSNLPLRFLDHRVLDLFLRENGFTSTYREVFRAGRYAFVKFSTREEVERAVTTLNGLVVDMGERLVVEFSHEITPECNVFISRCPEFLTEAEIYDLARTFGGVHSHIKLPQDPRWGPLWACCVCMNFRDEATALINGINDIPMRDKSGRDYTLKARSAR